MEIRLTYSDLKVLLAFGHFDRTDGVSIVLEPGAANAAVDLYQQTASVDAAEAFAVMAADSERTE